MNMADISDKMTGALGKIGEVLEDLSSLEVQTYSGSIDVAIDTALGDNGKLKSISDLLASAKATDNDLQLRVVTKMMCDGDAINLVPENDFPEHIQNVHAAAVKAGIDTRHGLLSLFGGMVGLKSSQ